MAEVVKTTFRLRRGDIKTWEENNPVLKKGEPGVAYENGRVKCLKIGDGISPWSKLEAIGAGEVSVGGDDYIYIGTEYPEDAPVGSLFINESEDGTEEPEELGPMEAYTTITSSWAVKEGELASSKYLNIQCHNLVPGEQYKIYLYNTQRQRGLSFKGWRHAPNYDFDDSVSNISRLGYGKLTSADPEGFPQKYEEDYKNYLQTEWDVPVDNDGTYTLSLNYANWFSPMIKLTDPITLVGAPKGRNFALWYKFKVVRVRDGAIGKCDNIVKIGQNNSGKGWMITLSIQ